MTKPKMNPQYVRYGESSIARRKIRTQQSTIWQSDAACGRAPEEDKAIFTGPYPNRAEAVDLVKRYCHKCPVINECADWGHNETSFSGIAGGIAFSVNNNGSSARRTTSMIKVEEDKI